MRADIPFYGNIITKLDQNGRPITASRQLNPWPEEPENPKASLVVQAEGYGATTAEVVLGDNTNLMDFTLHSGNVFRGHLVDIYGNPIANAVVRTSYDRENQLPASFDWATRTDGYGRFQWDSAPTNEVCYWFGAAGFQIFEGVRLVADGSDHEIMLKLKAAR